MKLVKVHFLTVISLFFIISLVCFGNVKALNAELFLKNTIKTLASTETEPSSYAVDGNMKTRWETEHGVDPSWIVFEFKEEKEIDSMVIHWETASARKYDIQISSSGKNWETVKSINNGKEGETKHIKFNKPYLTDYLRIYCSERATSWGYSIWEIDFNPKIYNGLLLGAINSRVVCKNDPSQSYAVYIPKSYDPEKKASSIVYGFSPDGRGEDPVGLLKDSAEKHGFIVAGSNNAKNGPWSDIKRAIHSIVKDTEYRFRLDSRRRYACGFSGGARMSFLMSDMYPSRIIGVIPVCGGFHENNYKPASYVSVYGISGKSDMNNGEMRRSLKSLGWPGNTRIQFVEFDGGHGWPPKNYMEDAVDWMIKK